jgi:hypothetical protein
MSMGEQPQTRRQIREAERGRRGWVVPVLVGVLAIAVLAGALWLGKGLLTSTEPTGSPSAIAGASTTAPTGEVTPTEEPSTEPSTQPTTEPTTEPTVQPDPVIAAVASCRTAWRLQSAVRADAYRSIGQWQRHLEIMNELQANKITLAQAKAAWPATTARAEEFVAAFRAADKARAAAQGRCAVDAAATGPKADAVRRCAASMRTVDGVLAKARIAIAPWETHLKDQSHFKGGGMTPAAAEAAWRVKWKQGLATVPGYTAVAPQGQRAVCSLPG